MKNGGKNKKESKTVFVKQMIFGMFNSKNNCFYQNKLAPTLDMLLRKLR